MNLRRRATHGHKPDGTLSLINIVLLLVLAFMMAGSISDPLPLDFEPIQSETGKRAEGQSTPAILTIDVNGRASFESGDIFGSKLDLLLVAFADAGREVEIRVDARAPARAVIAVLGVAEHAGVADVQIVTLDRQK